jgi:hypothetical protein
MPSIRSNPEEVSPTWDNLLDASLTSPVLYRAVHLERAGIPREQALLGACMALDQIVKDLQQEVLKCMVLHGSGRQFFSRR